MPVADHLEEHVISALRRERLVPVIRSDSQSELRDRLSLCREAELGVVELTATTPGWDEVLTEATASVGTMGPLIGVGTISTVDQGLRAVACGAAFLVSPFAVPRVRAAVDGRVTLIEAGMTPIELAAASATSKLVKLFPATSVGVGHMRAIRDVLPGVEIMPTGGIGIADASRWIEAGAIAVGMGSGLFTLSAERIAELKQELLTL